MKSDAISIVEAAYDCESEARGWLEGLLERVAPKLDRGFGVGASMYAPGIAPDRMPIASRCRDEKIASAAIGMCVTYPAHFHRLNATHRAVATASKTLNMTADEFQSWLPFVEFLHPFGIRDASSHSTHPCPTYAPRRLETRDWCTWESLSFVCFSPLNLPEFNGVVQK